MLISCDCSVDVDEAPTLFSETFRVARKVHKCCECYREILPREKYHSATGLWDGEWSTFKTCLGCSRIRNHLCYWGSEFGNLSTQVEECIGFNYVSGA